MLITPPPTNNFEFGLQNKNSAADRIGASQSAQQRVVDNKNTVRNTNTDGFADLGLQDRGTAPERLANSRQVKQTIIQNHGFEAKEFTKNALTNNTKIINIPVQQRGSLLDIKI